VLNRWDRSDALGWPGRRLAGRALASATASGQRRPWLPGLTVQDGAAGRHWPARRLVSLT